MPAVALQQVGDLADKVCVAGGNGGMIDIVIEGVSGGAILQRYVVRLPGKGVILRHHFGGRG